MRPRREGPPRITLPVDLPKIDPCERCENKRVPWLHVFKHFPDAPVDHEILYFKCWVPEGESLVFSPCEGLQIIEKFEAKPWEWRRAAAEHAK